MFSWEVKVWVGLEVGDACLVTERGRSTGVNVPTPRTTLASDPACVAKTKPMIPATPVVAFRERPGQCATPRIMPSRISQGAGLRKNAVEGDAMATDNQVAASVPIARIVQVPSADRTGDRLRIATRAN